MPLSLVRIDDRLIHGQVVSPGVDPIGNQVTIDPANGFAVCFRRPETMGWGPILQNDRFGADGSTLWVSFHARRAPGAQRDPTIYASRHRQLQRCHRAYLH